MTCPRIRSPTKEDCCDELRINPLPLLTRGLRRGDAPGLPDWKPFYYLLEDALNVMLVNSRDARNRPSRKTDLLTDAAWLADLGAHGLLRPSLVPPPPMRRLRDLTRARTDLTRDPTRQIHRLEKVLEDAGIKLSSVATDIMGQSSRAMLDALIEGKAHPASMADLAQRRLRSKIPALTEALTGRLTTRCGTLVRMHHHHSGHHHSSRRWLKPPARPQARIRPSAARCAVYQMRHVVGHTFRRAGRMSATAAGPRPCWAQGAGS